MKPQARTARHTVITLVRAPRLAYRFPTDLLARTLAIIRTSYGGNEPTPGHRAMQEAERQISATIRARQQLDAQARQQAPQQPAQARPPAGPAKAIPIPPHAPKGSPGGAAQPTAPRPDPWQDFAAAAQSRALAELADHAAQAPPQRPQFNF